MRWPAACAVAFALLLGTQGGGAAALPLEPNTRFTLGNHPDGAAAEPFYGLRIDALAGCDRDCGDDDDRDDDGDADLGAFVFDFGFCDPLAAGCQVTSEAVANGAAMTLDTLPDGSLHIHGTAWGGRVVDHEFEDALLWAIDFRYTALAFDPDEGSQFAEEGSGSGTLTALQTRGAFQAGQVFALEDEDGKRDISFALALGYRGFAGLSGFGGLDPEDLEDCDEHGKRGQKAEWLFTASNPGSVPVPEPDTRALAALGLLGLALRARRRRSRG
jgi:MYXO-CTERM domain-containing protein